MPLPRGTIEGRVVYDPELRFSTTGMQICTLRVVAGDRRKNDQSGDWEDGDQLWIDVTCFKQMAENVAEHVHKGNEVVVTGRYKTDEWDDKDTGAKRSKTVFVADVVAKSLRWAGKPAERSTGPESAGYTSADPWASPQHDEPPF